MSIYIKQIDTNTLGTTLSNSIYELIETIPYVKPGYGKSPAGPTKSTVFSEIKTPHIRAMPGFDLLEKEMLKHLSTLTTGIEIKTCWVNVMYKDSFVGPHKHDKFDGVAIYYFKVPDNSAKLQYEINDVYEELEVTEGMLVLHSPTLMHKVSVHNNEEPRICVVYNFKCDQKI
jgi:hypothetical protein